MAKLGKTAFAKELNVSPAKLDSLMAELDLTYEVTPKDRKLQVVSDEAQKKLKKYLDTGEKPEDNDKKK